MGRKMGKKMGEKWVEKWAHVLSNTFLANRYLPYFAFFIFE
jgi:hypothetical protein